MRSTRSDSFPTTMAIQMNAPSAFLAAGTLSDSEVIERVVAGERELFGTLVQRYNQRLFRLVRSIVHPDAEAEDALQEAYLSAFTGLDGFKGRSSFSTWISTIAIRTAGARRDRAHRMGALHHELAVRGPANGSIGPDPEDEAAASEARRIVESVIDSLPAHYRSVVVMRLVEGLSTAETAVLLDVSEEVVRIRLHRGREKLRLVLTPRFEGELPTAFAFLGQRCSRMVHAVLRRIKSLNRPPRTTSSSRERCVAEKRDRQGPRHHHRRRLPLARLLWAQYPRSPHGGSQHCG